MEAFDEFEEAEGIPTLQDLAIFTANGTISTKQDWVAGVDPVGLPDSFRSMSTKERLCIEYSEDFRRQFNELFPNRRLFLSSLSEGGCQKLVCTTIRPTMVPIRELNDIKSAARFVSRHCRYEPLADPTAPPSTLPSPTAILNRRAGDSFDLSVLLVSLLLGAGYDAYVAVGTAPAWVTLRDTTRDECLYEVPNLPEPAPGYQRDVESALYSIERRPPSPIPSRYLPPAPPQIESRYDAEMEARLEAKRREEEEAEDYESDVDETRQDEWLAEGVYEGTTAVVPASNEEDPLAGERVHAWVMVLPGRRNVESVLFVEPSTGHIYNTSDAPYETIESVFNNVNIWVNMQAQMLVPGAEPWLESTKDDEEENKEEEEDLEESSENPEESKAQDDEDDPIERMKQKAIEALRRPPTKEAAIDAVSSYIQETTQSEEGKSSDDAKKDEATDATDSAAPAATTAAGAAAAAASSSNSPDEAGGTGITASAAVDGEEPAATLGEGQEDGARKDAADGGKDSSLNKDAGALDGDATGDDAEGTEEVKEGEKEQGGPMSLLRYDLGRTEDWEHVFIPAPEADEVEEAKDVNAEEEGDEATGGPGTTTGSGVVEEDGEEKKGDAGEEKNEDENAEDGEEARELEEEEDYEKDGEHILDLPPPWPDSLRVPREAVLRGEGLGDGGMAVEIYHRCKLEEFAPYAHARGLVARITRYADDARLLASSVTEVFQHRSDKLVRRVTCPLEWTVTEEFAPGRERGDGLRRIVEHVGDRREVEYWTSARVDGLLRRTEYFGRKIVEEFDPGAAPNRLEYRSVTFGGAADARETMAMAVEAEGGALPGPGTPSASAAVGGSTQKSMAKAGESKRSARGGASSKDKDTASVVAGTGSSARVMEATGGVYRVSKMSLRFARNPSLPAHEDPAKIKFLLAENEIEVRYHVADGRVVPTVRSYAVPEGSASMRLLSADPFAPLPSEYEREMDFRRVLAMQRVCFDEVRTGHRRNGAKLLEDRAADEEELVLERDVFEIARQRARDGAPLGDDGPDQQVEEDTEPDPLAPFLLGVRDPDNMTYEEAKEVRQQCEEALKRRHLDRMMIIQRRLDAEEEALQRKQREFGRARGDDPSATEAFERQCADHIFRIGILQQRLRRQDKQFHQRVLELAALFRADRRLAKLYAHERDHDPKHDTGTAAPASPKARSSAVANSSNSSRRRRN